MRQFINVTHVLGDRHNRVFLTFGDASFDFSDQIVTAEFNFRNDDEFAATGNCCRQSQVTTVAPHHFNDGDTLVRRRSVTQTVNRFYHGAQCGEVADSVVGAFNIIVDSTRQANARETHFSQTFCTQVGTVTTDNNQGVNPTLLQVFDSHSAHVFVAEFREASRTEESTATVDHVGHAITVELNHTVFIQTQVAIMDPHDFQSFRQRCTYNTTDCCVHARRITAACQHTDFLNHDYL